jgi:glycosyltransferase involved in cell wall biosynthesis
MSLNDVIPGRPACETASSSPQRSSPRQSQPRAVTLTASADYTRCFDAALRRLGVEVLQGEWSGRWLGRNIRRGDILNFHWPSFLYYHPGAPLRTWWHLLRFFVLMVALRARGAKIVWTAHNLYPHDSGRAVLAHRVGRRIIVALASFICAHGQIAAARVRREFSIPAVKLVLLEHGNWIGFYPNMIAREGARERLDIPQNAYVFLFVGLCKPYKNLEYLLRSHSALEDDSALWIVGHFQSQSYYAQVTRTAALIPARRTTIRNGLIAPEEIQLYLNACDAVVLPYREILTSGAAMLALSFGRPVVAPRMGTLEELITDECGVLYPPESDAALGEAMRIARERRFAPQKVIRRAEHFSWDRSALAFVSQVIERR